MSRASRRFPFIIIIGLGLVLIGTSSFAADPLRRIRRVHRPVGRRRCIHVESGGPRRQQFHRPARRATARAAHRRKFEARWQGTTIGDSLRAGCPRRCPSPIPAALHAGRYPASIVAFLLSDTGYRRRHGAAIDLERSRGFASSHSEVAHRWWAVQGIESHQPSWESLQRPAEPACRRWHAPDRAPHAARRAWLIVSVLVEETAS